MPHLMLRHVTFTGADNNTDCGELRAFSECYPLAEFGILFSPSRVNTPRYPRNDWVHKFLNECKDVPKSAHLCGKSLRDFASGANPFWHLVMSGFSRVQLNMNWKGVDGATRSGLWQQIKNHPQTQFIVQYNSNNLDAYRYFAHLPNVAILFDKSGGRGTTLEFRKLPSPIPGFFCGYAGGIQPSNIDLLMLGLKSAVQEGSTWIDMESGVRTNDEFDLEKAEIVMELLR